MVVSGEGEIGVTPDFASGGAWAQPKATASAVFIGSTCWPKPKPKCSCRTPGILADSESWNRRAIFRGSGRSLIYADRGSPGTNGETPLVTIIRQLMHSKECLAILQRKLKTMRPNRSR